MNWDEIRATIWNAIGRRIFPEAVDNQFCKTGEGGGVDPSCGKGEGGKSDGGSKPKGISKDADVKIYAAAVADSVATMLGGLTEGQTADAGQKDKKPFDVRMPGNPKKGIPDQDIEVKTVVISGDKNKVLSVHDDALLRKVDHQEATGNGFHTVAVDARGDFEEGTHGAAESFSGHRMYYKRGSGRYSLNQMHPVKDAAELKRLVMAKDDALPEKARGSLPPPPPKEVIVERAEKANVARVAKDKAWKAANKEKLQAQAKALREKTKAAKGAK